MSHGTGWRTGNGPAYPFPAERPQQLKPNLAPRYAIRVLPTDQRPLSSLQEIRLPSIVYYSGGEPGLDASGPYLINLAHLTNHLQVRVRRATTAPFASPRVVGASAFSQPLQVNTQAAGNLGYLAMQP